MGRLRVLVKPWIVMPVAAGFALGGWMFVRGQSSSATPAAANDQVFTASTGTVAETVSAQGTVAAAQTDDLSFGAAGTVTAVNVTAGQQVKAGDVLAEIDSAALAAALSDAESTLAQAKAKLSDDQSAGASSAQIAADKSSVTTAEDKVANAQKALDGATLTASFDGTVAQVNITVGEQLGSGGTGGTSTTGGTSGSGRTSSNLGSSSNGQFSNSSSNSSSGTTPDIQVITRSSFVVDVGLDNSDISKIAAGQSASISVSTSTTTTFGRGAFPGAGAFPGGAIPGANTTDANRNASSATSAPATNQPTATGTVSSVSTVADASSGVAKYTVKVTFDDATGNFNAGATVDVKITYAEKQNVVEVPSFSVTTSNGTSTVTVLKNGSKEKREVTTGLSSGNMIEITSGLQAGEQVVLELPNFGGARATNRQGGNAPTVVGGPETGN